MRSNNLQCKEMPDPTHSLLDEVFKKHTRVRCLPLSQYKLRRKEKEAVYSIGCLHLATYLIEHAMLQGTGLRAVLLYRASEALSNQSLHKKRQCAISSQWW